jgi:hypothetical protein
LEERLWNAVTNRAVTEGTTVRELIPLLVNQSLAAPRTMQNSHPAAVSVSAPPVAAEPGESGLPVMPLADIYRCGVCGAEMRLGGVSNHMGKHKKEREAAEAERS